MFRVNSLFKGVFQGCIGKQGLCYDFPGVVLKLRIFQDVCEPCFIYALCVCACMGVGCSFTSTLVRPGPYG